MTWPIAAIVTCRPGRRWFFERFCLPSVYMNHPCQLVVEEGDPVPEARVEAIVRKVRMANVAFVEDDEVLGGDFFRVLLKALRDDPEADYAACDFVRVAWPSAGAPTAPERATSGARVLRKDPWLARRSSLRGLHVAGVHYMKFLLETAG